MSLEMNSATAFLVHKRILLLARSALISCIALEGKGHSRDDIPQTLVSYLYSIYSSVNLGCVFFFFLVGQILHSWHWSRRFLTDYSVFWLICNRRFFTRKLYSVWNYVLWMFSLLPTFLRWPGFLFNFFFFFDKIRLLSSTFPNQKAYKQAHRDNCWISEPFKLKRHKLGLNSL